MVALLVFIIYYSYFGIWRLKHLLKRLSEVKSINHIEIIKNIQYIKEKINKDRLLWRKILFTEQHLL